jgi:hypothetical protein
MSFWPLYFIGLGPAMLFIGFFAYVVSTKDPEAIPAGAAIAFFWPITIWPFFLFAAGYAVVVAALGIAWVVTWPAQQLAYWRQGVSTTGNADDG